MKTLMRLMAAALLCSAIFFISKQFRNVQAAGKTMAAAAVSHTNQYALTYDEEAKLKYIYGITVTQSCSGADKKIINGICETGRRVNFKTVKSGIRWYCYFNYEFSDGSVNGPYSETNTAPCFID